MAIQLFNLVLILDICKYNQKSLGKRTLNSNIFSEKIPGDRTCPLQTEYKQISPADVSF